MRKKSHRKNKVSYFSLGIVLVILIWVVSVGLILIDKWENEQFGENADANLSTVIEYNGTRYMYNPFLETIMILGIDTLDSIVDSGSYNNDYKADFLSLVIINDNEQSYKILHINRDTMTTVPVLGVTGQLASYEEMQIALSYNYGNGLKDSCENTKDAISLMLGGISINRYLTLGMSAIPILNDLAGGVTIELEDDFTELDADLVVGETITLNGEQALIYVRERGSLEDSSNLYRMERQQNYLQALYTELADTEISWFESGISDITDYMVTDSSVTSLEAVIGDLGTYEFEGIVSIDGESVVYDLYNEYYLDEESLEQTIIDLFYIELD
ncbi:MAG: LCP family protein [Clostridia bacterium]